jgi:alkanesulfonate monooxygenase SsuD/methylene tetrahydromethanopterin reductase-like flavin-dependent oxidoreductase (luciferase family)
LQYLQPLPLLARLAAESGEMRLATCILLLALPNPVDAAEQIATLDVITHGRLRLGVGLGYRDVEFEAFGVGRAERLSRFLANLDLVKRLLAGESVSFESPSCELRDVALSLRPAQQPHPPVWLPGSMSLETIDTAAKHRYPYMTVFMTTEQRRMVYNLYQRLAEEKYGYEAPPEQLAFCAPIFVAETDEQAMKEAEPYVLWLFDKAFFKVRPQYVSPPGYFSEQSMLRMLKSGVVDQMMKRRSFKELVDTGVVIVGSVDTVIEKLAYHSDELHAGMIINVTRLGPMPDELVYKQQDLMANYIMPHFRAKPVCSELQPVEVGSIY